MPIRVDTFGGIFPRMEAEKLPETGAQTALNVDLTSGALAPIDAQEPFVSMHDGSALIAGIPPTELREITKPDAPYLSRDPLYYLCQPTHWLSIKAHVWQTYIGSGGTLIEDHFSWDLPIINVRYELNGLRIRASLPSTSGLPPLPGAVLDADDNIISSTPFQVIGPIYQFFFSEDNGGYGGPSEDYVCPDSPNYGDPQLPNGSVSLFYNGKIYGQFVVCDVRGPEWSQTNESGYTTTQAVPLPASNPEFVIDLNYLQPQLRTYYFLQTMVQQIRDTKYEGPKSEVSYKITVNPGQLLQLETPLASTYTKNNLYVAGNAGDKFLLQAEVNDNDWTETFEGPQATVLPPNGNYTEAGVTKDAFLEGSIIHPAQFGVAFSNVAGDEDSNGTYLLWLSDYYRLNAWPEEWTIPFTEAISAIALTGNAVLVFSGSKVFSVAGSNPANMQKYQLSESHPLLNKLGLARIGQTVFWPTHDGLASSNGSEPQIVTRQNYTRKEWALLNPEDMKGSSADNTVYLTQSDSSKNIRVDLDEDLTRVTSFAAFTGVDFAWKSRKWRFPTREIFDYARVVADGEVALHVYADGAEIGSGFTVADSTYFPLTGSTYGLTWEFQVQGDARVQSVELFERVIKSGDAAMRFTPADTPIMDSIWVKFPERDRFVAGSLMAQTTSAVPIVISGRTGTELLTKSVPNGNVFTFPRAYGANPLADLLRISVQGSGAKIDELLLFCRRAKDASNSLREINSTGQVAPWLIARYELRDRARLKSLVVHARSSVTMNIYLDGADTPTSTQSVANGDEIRLSGFATASSVEFDFKSGGTPQDYLVEEVLINAQSINPIGDGGIDMNNPPSWRGNLFRFPDRGTFACASLGADDYSDVTFKLYKDGAGSAATTHTVTDGYVWLLPRDMGEGSVWEVDVDGGDAIVSNLIVKPRVRVAVGGRSIAVTADDTGVMPWAFSRYDFQEKTSIVAGQVIADPSAYPLTMRLFGEGDERSETPTMTITVADSKEFRIENFLRTGNLDFDFYNGATSDDYKVNKVYLHGKAPISCEPNGIIIRDGLAEGGFRRRFVNFKETGGFAVCRIVASDYTDMVLKLYANGVLKAELAVADNEDFKLPLGLPDAREWEFDIEHAGEIYELHLIGRTRTPLKDGGVHITRANEPFSWLGQRVAIDRPKDFSCGRVLASAYPVAVKFYQRGVLVKDVVFRDDQKRTLPRSRPDREWEFDAVAEAGEAVIIESVNIGTSMAGLG